MRIVFVLTYPTHHGVADVGEWLRWDNRDRRMPGILTELGVETELWGLAREPLDTVSALPGIVPGALDRPAGCLLSPRCPYVQDSCRAQRPGLDPKSHSLARCFYPLNQEVA